MKVSEMRQLSAEELDGKIDEWKDELFRARCNKAVGQLADTSQVRTLRRRVARAETISNEKRRDAASQ